MGLAVCSELCPECSYTGISDVTGGVGPWPGHSGSDTATSAKCPRCECKPVRVGAFVEGNDHVA